MADRVILEAIYGEFNAIGSLLIALNSSMDAVRAQKPDVPYDSEDPLCAWDWIDLLDRGATVSLQWITNGNQTHSPTSSPIKRFVAMAVSFVTAPP